MIKQVEIKNFKSIAALKLELGRFNIFIGENGCGKTNILEAIALGGAASANKLDSEFLSSRGIRITEPQLMRSAFDKRNINKPVEITFISGDESQHYHYKIQNKNVPYSEWYDINRKEGLPFSNHFENETPFSRNKPNEKLLKHFESKDFAKIYESIVAEVLYNKELAGFLLFSPENSFLRKFEDEEKIKPLGIKGEGLFKLLKTFYLHDKTAINKLKETLTLLDWYEDFELPSSTFEGEKFINIKDKYIDKTIEFIHQQSSNEGFLFLLFYLSLFISKDTPNFFAIDNIEASFNPKLCAELIRVLNKLSSNPKRKKQVVITTHNPFILDGLNLKDDDQRLFVIRRNTDGHTIAKRIEYVESKYKLSEAWMLGFFGGLPNNF